MRWATTYTIGSSKYKNLKLRRKEEKKRVSLLRGLFMSGLVPRLAMSGITKFVVIFNVSDKVAGQIR
jgi:hypothetical protein